jgi:hypothetical protein
MSSRGQSEEQSVDLSNDTEKGTKPTRETAKMVNGKQTVSSTISTTTSTLPHPMVNKTTLTNCINIDMKDVAYKAAKPDACVIQERFATEQGNDVKHLERLNKRKQPVWSTRSEADLSATISHDRSCSASSKDETKVVNNNAKRVALDSKDRRTWKSAAPFADEEPITEKESIRAMRSKFLDRLCATQSSEPLQTEGISDESSRAITLSTAPVSAPDEATELNRKAQEKPLVQIVEADVEHLCQGSSKEKAIPALFMADTPSKMAEETLPEPPERKQQNDGSTNLTSDPVCISQTDDKNGSLIPFNFARKSRWEGNSIRGKCQGDAQESLQMNNEAATTEEKIACDRHRPAKFNRYKTMLSTAYIPDKEDHGWRQDVNRVLEKRFHRMPNLPMLDFSV